MGAPELRVLPGREVPSLPPAPPELRVLARILIDELHTCAHNEARAEAWGAREAAYGWRCRQAALRAVLGRIRGLLPDHNRGLLDV